MQVHTGAYERAATAEYRARLESVRALSLMGKPSEISGDCVALWVNYVGFFLHTARGQAHRPRPILWKTDVPGNARVLHETAKATVDRLRPCHSVSD